MINSLLGEVEGVIAGYHELAHLLLHEPGETHCSIGDFCNYRKTERQAQTISVIGLLPQKMLGEDLSDYPRQIVEYRQEI